VPSATNGAAATSEGLAAGDEGKDSKKASIMSSEIPPLELRLCHSASRG
jgi:hypothetical protein